MNPVFQLERPDIWDAEKLGKEAEEVKHKALQFPFTYKGKDFGVIKAVPCLPQYEVPELEKFRDLFLEQWPNDWGEIAVSYMYIDSEYPWHVDTEVTKRYGNPKGTLCALNIILNGVNDSVEFEEGKFTYEAAIIDTSKLHRVTPTKERTMARISFKDKTFKEVVKGIR